MNLVPLILFQLTMNLEGLWIFVALHVIFFVNVLFEWNEILDCFFMFLISFKSALKSWRTSFIADSVAHSTADYISTDICFYSVLISLLWALIAQNILDTILNVGPTRLRENLPRLAASIFLFLCHPVHSVFQLLRPDQSIYCLLALAAAAAHGYK